MKKKLIMLTNNELRILSRLILFWKIKNPNWEKNEKNEFTSEELELLNLHIEYVRKYK